MGSVLLRCGKRYMTLVLLNSRKSVKEQTRENNFFHKMAQLQNLEKFEERIKKISERLITINRNL